MSKKNPAISTIVILIVLQIGKGLDSGSAPTVSLLIRHSVYFAFVSYWGFC